VDGDHTYDGVRRDVDVAVLKLKDDGTLVFNDYIVFSHFEMQMYGVVHVVNEMCPSGEWEMVGLALDTQMYCDVALRQT
jgi:hypothetical protein